MSSVLKNKTKGFTLLEILLVVGIIAILAGIVIVAINPNKQLGTVRNTERKSDIKQIDSALKQYYIDHNRFPTSTPDTLTEICDTATTTYPTMTATCEGQSLIDLSILVPTYLTAIPRDPQASSTYHTGYSFLENPNKNIIIQAINAELGTFIAIGTTTGGGECDSSCVTALNSGLVGYWPLNGSAVDENGGNNGSWTGAEAYDSGKVGQAGSFNGSTSYITASDSALPVGSSDRTMCAWVKPATADYGTIMKYGQDNSSYILSRLLLVPDGHIVFNGYYADISSDGTYSSGSWKNICFVYGSSTGTLYLNGSADASSYLGLNTASEQGLQIGVMDGQQYFNGLIDEVAIWDRALSGTEISHIYNGGAGVSLSI